MVLDRYHDTPGESGLSPYQIMFGRERSLANLPYETYTECEDAVNFFDRMEALDEEVARILNAKHVQRNLIVNVHRQPSKVYNVGDLVWYWRPPDSGDKLSTRWLGPCRVTKVVGEHSYELQITPTRKVSAVATFLKPYNPDKFIGTPVSLYTHRRTQIDTQLTPED